MPLKVEYPDELLAERTALPGADISGFLRFELSTVMLPLLLKPDITSLDVVEPTVKLLS